MKPRRRKLPGCSPVERAIIAQQWDDTAVRARIHALIGQDSDQFVSAAGRVLFVVLGALLIEQIDPDMVEVRIVRGACNALIEQAGEPHIDPLRRASIRAGLEAAGQLLAVLPRKARVDAAVDLRYKLDRGDVWASDYQALLGLVEGIAA
ncbi:MAG TPA: hypothetical protein PLW24_06750 [Burkholderiaceae bacterium]|nr:hypothetical protein [Burkholderiaceae bacterium]